MGLFHNTCRVLNDSILFNPIWICLYRLHGEIRQGLKVASILSSDKWLDVGCGSRPFEHLFPVGVYVGVDVKESGRSADLKSPDFYYDGEVLPFPNNYFQGIICTQVLEHVSNPRKLLQEMSRVVVPGGGMLLTVPLLWQEHEVPYDYYRFTRFGISELIRDAGFKVKSIKADNCAIESLAVAVNIYIMSNLVPSIKGFSYLYALVLCFPIQIMAIIIGKIFPDKGGLYLNLIVFARKNVCKADD